MKHPALTRVFSVVLIIMSLIMLLSGWQGFGKTVDEREEALAYAERLSERIETYKQLEQQINNSISYEEAYAELEKLQEEHDAASSQHRTDLATYSATKGGYTMGLNTINDAKAQLADGKAQLEAGKQKLAQSEAELTQSEAWYNANVTAINSSIADCGTAAADCGAKAADAGIYAGSLSAAMAAEPAVPEDQSDAAAMAQYAADLAAWKSACAATLSGAPVAEWFTSVQSGATVLAAAAALLPSGSGGGAGAVPQLSDPTTFTEPAQMLAALNGIQYALAGEAGALSAAASGLGAIGPGIDAGKTALAEGKAKLSASEAALKKGEQQLQANLENIWYNLGELEKDEQELTEEKERLSEESDKLGKMIISTDDKKALEDKLTVTRVLLKNVDGIKMRIENGGEVAESAESYLQEYNTDAERTYKGKLIICTLALLCGISGFAGMPGAFEKTKKRFWLVFPVALCFLFACSADGINMYLGLGQMYAALFTAIFALLQLLVIIPGKKKLN